MTSPDGKRAALIRDWNLWVRDVATKQEKALTTDGVKDFGYATDNAGWVRSDRAIVLWSPDSKKIATFLRAPVDLDEGTGTEVPLDRHRPRRNLGPLGRRLHRCGRDVPHASGLHLGVGQPR